MADACLNQWVSDADPAAQQPDGRPGDGLRVLMIAPTSFFADYGCHVRILEETKVLQRLGCRVTVCTYHNGRDLPGMDIRRTVAIPWRHGYEVGSSRHKVAFDLLLFATVAATFFRFRPHVVHAHLHEGALIGLPLAWAGRVPLVFDFQGSLTGEMVDHHFLRPDGRLFGPMRRLERAIDRAAPHILTSSGQSGELLTGAFGCDPSRVTLVPDCVDTHDFSPPQDPQEVRRARRAWDIPPGRVVVVYLGLLAGYQGTDHLLEAARSIRARRDDLHWVIAGFPNVEHYQQRAAELGIADAVTFTGKVRYEDAPHILALGDVAVCPKLSATEGAGKLLNYMAMALPTVAFDTPVSHEYLGDLGVYARRGDADDLALQIERLCDDPARRAALGAGLRRRAQQRYDWESAGRTILDIYRSVMR